MKLIRVLQPVLMLLTFSISTQAFARSYPMGLSLFAASKDVFWQAPSPESTVCGLRLGLIRSLNDSVCGIDIGGLISESKEKFSGMAASGLANIDGEAKIYLFQIAGFVNSIRSGKVYGIQVAGITNQIHDEGKLRGIQASILWNHASKIEVWGAQLGAVNRAARVIGLQVGLINVADDLTGIQIGLLNFNKAAAPLYFFPGLNVGF